MSTIKKWAKFIFQKTVKKQIQDFNLENRAHKLLDNQKLPPAPKHEKDEKLIKEFLKENPELKSDVKTKDPKLVDDMGKFKINVLYPEENKSSKKKNLPKSKEMVEFKNKFRSKKIPPGSIDFSIFLRAYDCKYNHLWSNEEIAEEFDLDEDMVENLMFYFRPFNRKINDKKQIVEDHISIDVNNHYKFLELIDRDPFTYQKKTSIIKTELQETKQEVKKEEDITKYEGYEESVEESFKGKFSDIYKEEKYVNSNKE